MAYQTQTKNMAFIALQKATRIGYANDDEVDDKKLAASTSGRYESDEKSDGTSVKQLPYIDIFCYPKHPNLMTKEVGKKFWNDLATGECNIYDDQPTKDGKMFNDIKNWISIYGSDPDAEVVLFISGKYAEWLAALPTFANVFIILAGGSYNPRELTDSEMSEISTKDGSKPRYYIDHMHQINLDVEANNNIAKTKADKLPYFRNITPYELKEFGSEGWDALAKIPALMDTLMDFIYTDNFSSDELIKIGTVKKFTDKLTTLPNFNDKLGDVERVRRVVDLLFRNITPCTREDLQYKTSSGLRFQGSYCTARAVMRDLLNDIWPDGEWGSKFFSLRSKLGEQLVNCEPNLVWGDCAIALSLSKTYQHMFVSSKRTFKRNEKGFVSAVKDANPVGNFYTLEFLPNMPLSTRAEMYGKISMEWWKNFLVNWAEKVR